MSKLCAPGEFLVVELSFKSGYAEFLLLQNGKQMQYEYSRQTTFHYLKMLVYIPFSEK
jgi:hypothetical protein